MTKSGNVDSHSRGLRDQRAGL